MVRVLHIVGRLNRGGIETFLMNIYRSIDCQKVQFDFLIQTEEKCDYEDEILKLGGRIYRIPPKRKSLFQNMAGTIRVIRENNYKIVHRHSAFPSMWFDLFLAMAAGSKIRIAHSHAIEIRKWYYGIWQFLLNHIATHKYACSLGAGEYMYGKSKFEIIKNAVILENFVFDIKTREKMREKYHLQGKTVIGHIGRFSKFKNQKLLIEVLSQIQKNRNDYMLVLIGAGEDKQNIEDCIKKKSLEKQVNILSPQENIWDFYQIFDLLALPSFNEGLGMVLIEAQISGLRCLVSEAIPPEAFVTSRIEAIPLSKGAKMWADKILSYDDLDQRGNHIQEIEKCGYGAEQVAKELTKIYLGA